MGLRREDEIDEDEGRPDDQFALPSRHARDDTFLAGAHGYSELGDDADMPPHRRSAWITAAKTVLAAAGLAWVGFTVWLFAMRGFRLPAPDQIPLAAAGLCAPLILVGLLFLILLRTSVGEATRFGRITAQLKHEAEMLDMRLAVINQQLDTARHTMGEQAGLLEEYGGSASLNLEAAAKTMAQHASTAAQQTEMIERAGLALAHQFGQLIDAMPSLEERASHISSNLAEGGAALADKVDRLEARLESLSRLLDETKTRTTNTTQSLTAQLMRIQDSARSASDEVSGMADLGTNRVDAAVEQVRNAIAEAGTALDARTLQLSTLIERSRSALDDIGGETVTGYENGITRIEGALRELDRFVQDRTTAIADAGESLSGRIERLNQEFGELQTATVSGSERMTNAIDGLSQRTVQLDEALQSGSRAAETIIARTESLLVALDASVRELDEGHPAALARLNDKIDITHRLLGVIMPEIGRLETVSATILGQVRESEELLSGQGRKLKAWLDSGEASLAACHEQIRELQLALEGADNDARRLSDSAGPQLVATLLRVKDAAEQAGEKARQALARAIADATEEMGDASERVLSERVGEQFQGRMEELGVVADRAVKAAHAASERLMRQLITIADTTSSIEQRFSEADEAAQRREQDNFSRRSSMLIESLNSAAIDVAQILGTDVGDASWAAYLEGDRGVFSRRAVRLISHEDARSVLDLYRENEDFRDGVNRYIHDFEAMLRNVLVTRDGTSMAVTLLSSDIGKLYVALAQAIDRLKDG